MSRRDSGRSETRYGRGNDYTSGENKKRHGGTVSGTTAAAAAIGTKDKPASKHGTKDRAGTKHESAERGISATYNEYGSTTSQKDGMSSYSTPAENHYYPATEDGPASQYRGGQYEGRQSRDSATYDDHGLTASTRSAAPTRSDAYGPTTSQSVYPAPATSKSYATPVIKDELFSKSEPAAVYDYGSPTRTSERNKQSSSPAPATKDKSVNRHGTKDKAATTYEAAQRGGSAIYNDFGSTTSTTDGTSSYPTPAASDFYPTIEEELAGQYKGGQSRANAVHADFGSTTSTRLAEPTSSDAYGPTTSQTAYSAPGTSKGYPTPTTNDEVVSKSDAAAIYDDHVSPTRNERKKQNSSPAPATKSKSASKHGTKDKAAIKHGSSTGRGSTSEPSKKYSKSSDHAAPVTKDETGTSSYPAPTTGDYYPATKDRFASQYEGAQSGAEAVYEDNRSPTSTHSPPPRSSDAYGSTTSQSGYLASTTSKSYQTPAIKEEPISKSTPTNIDDFYGSPSRSERNKQSCGLAPATKDKSASKDGTKGNDVIKHGSATSGDNASKSSKKDVKTSDYPAPATNNGTSSSFGSTKGKGKADANPNPIPSKSDGTGIVGNKDGTLDKYGKANGGSDDPCDDSVSAPRRGDGPTVIYMVTHNTTVDKRKVENTAISNIQNTTAYNTMNSQTQNMKIDNSVNNTQNMTIDNTTVNNTQNTIVDNSTADNSTMYQTSISSSTVKNKSIGGKVNNTTYLSTAQTQQMMSANSTVNATGTWPTTSGDAAGSSGASTKKPATTPSSSKKPAIPASSAALAAQPQLRKAKTTSASASQVADVSFTPVAGHLNPPHRKLFMDHPVDASWNKHLEDRFRNQQGYRMISWEPLGASEQWRFVLRFTDATSATRALDVGTGLYVGSDQVSLSYVRDVHTPEPGYLNPAAKKVFVDQNLDDGSTAYFKGVFGKMKGCEGVSLEPLKMGGRWRFVVRFRNVESAENAVGELYGWPVPTGELDWLRLNYVN